ncbi:MAG: tetratricopeptide repeat protein [Planctomycetaceae bacterium]|nr:tetratricopeptide repeat protein [Planctomycetaceae bacterium]
MTRRAAEIFGEVRELPVERREAYLAGACGTDEGLRAEVEALLKADVDAGQFMASPTAERAAVAGGPAAEQAGAQIGRYRLLELIGEGGMGTIWMAEQREPVRRRVALKLIKIGLDTRQVIARFEAERQALAMMEHPNIAKVLDAGATELGRPYFVMEYIKGVPILEYCDREQVDTRARLELFAKVCQAIQHAHQKGVIHRDIKPSNVLVTLHDGVPVPKVIDFGIAKATNAELTSKTLFTEHRQMVGTPAYMSPEQAEMGGLDIDTRSDIYSLGVLLYELLTGTTPFDIKALLESGFGEMLRAIREDEPHKPSTRISSLGETGTRMALQRNVDLKRLSGMLRGDIDWIVMKCLEKDRTRRYETANGLAADIQRHLNDEPVTAGAPSAAYRLQKFVRRHRGKVLAGSAIALALVLGVIGTSVALVRALEEKERADAAVLAEGLARTTAQQNEQRAVEQALLAAAAQAEEAQARRRAETIRDFVVAALRAGDAAHEGGRADATIVEAMDAAIADLDLGRFRDDPATAADLRLTIANILRTNGRYDAALAQAEAALRAERTLHGGDAPGTAAALCEIGSCLDRLGRGEESELRAREALEMYERLYSGDNYHVAALRSNLGDRLRQQRRNDEAQPLLESAVEMLRRLDKGAELAKGLGNLAQLRETLGDDDGALRFYEEALAVHRREHAGDHPDLAVAINNLAVFCAGIGETERGETLLAEALEMRQRMFRGDHPVVAESLLNLAFLRATNGEPEAALPMLEQALAMNQRLFPDGHPNLAHGLYTLGTTRLAAGDVVAAEGAFDRSLAMHRTLFEGDHIGTAMSLAKRGRARAAQADKAAGARSDFDEALAMLRRMPEGRPPLCEVLWSSAQLRRAGGDLSGALAEFEELVPLAESVFAADSPRLPTYREALEACRKAVSATGR